MVDPAVQSNQLLSESVEFCRNTRASSRENGRATFQPGSALRGLIIRHLVLPNNIAGTYQFVRFVAEELAPSTFVNLMSQYRPEHEAFERPELRRRVTRQEYARAVNWAREAGLANASSQT